jgi:hypothetical protein
MYVRRNEVFDDLLARQDHLGDCGVFLASWFANCCEVTLLTILHFCMDVVQQSRYLDTRLTYHLGSNTVGTRRYGTAMSIKSTSLGIGSAPRGDTLWWG